jgi:dCTP diphosphatase
MNDTDPAPDKLIDAEKLQAALAAFAHARDWEQFHSPKNLAMAISGEVGELVEIFQWLTEEQSRLCTDNNETAHAVADELADVLMYTVRLADVLGIDLNEAISRKLAKNNEKYPVDKARGSSKKYDKL